MNAGVCTAPCGVMNVPARAAPTEAICWKVNVTMSFRAKHARSACEVEESQVLPVESPLPGRVEIPRLAALARNDTLVPSLAEQLECGDSRAIRAAEADVQLSFDRL